MLVRHVYKPLRRQGCGRWTAVCATFVATGAVHAYPLAVAGARLPALAATLFFFFPVQPLLLGLEAGLGLDGARRARAAAKAGGSDRDPAQPSLPHRAAALGILFCALILPFPLLADAFAVLFPK